jgi:hypothetical protein
MFAQSSWLEPGNVQAGNTGAKLHSRFADGRRGGRDAGSVSNQRTHYDSCLRRDDDKCTVRCDKLEHGEPDACWRGCDNRAVSHRLVLWYPVVRPAYYVPAQRGAHDSRFAPTPLPASSKQQAGKRARVGRRDWHTG